MSDAPSLLPPPLLPLIIAHTQGGREGGREEDGEGTLLSLLCDGELLHSPSNCARNVCNNANMHLGLLFFERNAHFLGERLDGKYANTTYCHCR